MCPLSPRRLLARLRKLSGYRAERFLRHLELFLIVYIYFRIKSLRPTNYVSFLRELFSALALWI